MTGAPIEARWTRIWCFRPVTGMASISSLCEVRARTRTAVLAGDPEESTRTVPFGRTRIGLSIVISVGQSTCGR